MYDPRLTVGGVTATSARFRLDSWEPPNEYLFPLHIWSRGFTDFVIRGASSNAEVKFESAPLFSGDVPNRWIVDVRGLSDNQPYELQFVPPVGEPSNPVEIQTAPAKLLTGVSLKVAVASCYFPSDEYKDNAAIMGALLREKDLPTATFLCGDQIYADVPKDKLKRSLEGLYRGRYEEAWQRSRLGTVLEAGGNFFVPDDHEYWNGYPELMPWLSRSGPRRWSQTSSVAAQAFWVNQGVWNFPEGFTGGEQFGQGWGYGQLGAVDVFISDTRTQRTNRKGDRRPGNGEPQTFASKTQFEALLKWIKDIRRVGILVVSQPLVSIGGFFDNTFSDYPKQFRPLLDTIRDVIVEKQVSLVIVTGDIHWGRLISWTPSASSQGPKLIEFVASPIARVGTKSIFGTSKKVGRENNPQKKPSREEYKVVENLLPGMVRTQHFATGENNFGIFELLGTDDNGIVGRFQLFSLATREKANNPWESSNLSVCEAFVNL